MPPRRPSAVVRSEPPSDRDWTETNSESGLVKAEQLDDFHDGEHPNQPAYQQRCADDTYCVGIQPLTF